MNLSRNGKSKCHVRHIMMWSGKRFDFCSAHACSFEWKYMFVAFLFLASIKRDRENERRIPSTLHLLVIAVRRSPQTTVARAARVDSAMNFWPANRGARSVLSAKFARRRTRKLRIKRSASQPSQPDYCRSDVCPFQWIPVIFLSRFSSVGWQNILS